MKENNKYTEEFIRSKRPTMVPSNFNGTVDIDDNLNSIIIWWTSPTLQITEYMFMNFLQLSNIKHKKDKIHHIYTWIE
jgi:hypothetical protein